MAGLLHSRKQEKPNASAVQAAEDVVRAIGPNTFPFLLESTPYRISFGKRYSFAPLDETNANAGEAPNMGLSHPREHFAKVGVQGFRILKPMTETRLSRVEP